MLDRVATEQPELSRSGRFKETQRRVRWHYQWVVLHDFLPRMLGGSDLQAGRAVLDDILRVTPYAAGIDKGRADHLRHGRPSAPGVLPLA